MPSDLPEPAADLELSRLMGAWYVLVSNTEFWRERSHPRVEYEPLEPGAGGRARFLGVLRFRRPNLLGEAKPRLVVGTNEVARSGMFRWRGKGMLGTIKSRWCVPIVDPKGRWLVSWFARSRLGAPGGLDICTRDPHLPQAALDEILAGIRSHPFLGEAKRSGGLFATVQDWYPERPYRLG